MSFASGVGISTGIDYNAMIRQIRSINSRPISLIRQNQSKLQQKQQALGVIKQALLNLKGKAESLNSSGSFLSLSATSTDGNVLLANASNEAAIGDYSVKVRQLAQAHRIASQGVADIDATPIAAGAGKFEFKVGDGATVAIDVTNGMSLRQLRDAINNQNAGVRASIINDGTASHANRLVLTATSSGAANSIAIVANDTSLNLGATTIEEAYAATGNAFDGTVTSSGVYTGTTTRNIVVQITEAGAVGAAKFKVSYDGGVTWSADNAFTTSAGPQDITGALGEGVMLAFGAGTQDFAVGDRFTIDAFAPELQKAQDALIEVDGVTVSRATNVFTDVIQGVTLTARKVSEETQVIKVLNSNNSVQTKLQDLVNAYNDVVEKVQELTKYDKETNERAPLFGDSAVNSILSGLRSRVIGTVPGLETYNALSQIGITLDSTGKLQMDSAKVNSALNENLDAVKALFIQGATSGSSSIKFKAATSATTPGAYDVVITQAAEQAVISGANVLGPAGLAANERLVITHNGAAVSVDLTAGMTITEIVAKLNEEFSNGGLGAQAINDGGKLKITSTAYGSEETITVVSNQDAGAVNQLGIGTTKLSASGVDVAGTIAGITATGSGQVLKGAENSHVAGLELEVTTKTPLSTEVHYSKGISTSVFEQLDNLTKASTGLFDTRERSYTRQITDLDDRVDVLNQRLDTEEAAMRKKFTALETKISALQTQGNFLLSQLSSLIAT